jgi:hypothetical protein
MSNSLQVPTSATSAYRGIFWDVATGKLVHATTGALLTDNSDANRALASITPAGGVFGIPTGAANGLYVARGFPSNPVLLTSEPDAAWGIDVPLTWDETDLYTVPPTSLAPGMTAAQILIECANDDEQKYRIRRKIDLYMLRNDTGAWEAYSSGNAALYWFAMTDAGGGHWAGITLAAHGVSVPCWAEFYDDATGVIKGGRQSCDPIPSGTGIRLTAEQAAELEDSGLLIAAPINPAQITGYTVTRDGHGAPMGLIALTFMFLKGPGTGAAAFEGDQFTAISNETGLLTVDLLRKSTYCMRRGSGRWIEFQTDDGPTMALPEMVWLDEG